MNLLARWLRGQHSRLDAHQRARLAQWRRRPAPDLDRGHRQTRYVVVDVESSSVDPQTAALIAIGAVAVVDGCLAPHDAFSAVLRQAHASPHENILVHGIGAQAQSEGCDPADALLDFLEYAGRAPVIAYHAFFDRTMITRALRTVLGVDGDDLWVDLAWVLPELFPEVIDRKATLDEWQRAFRIESIQRHDALSDAWGTAQLLQIALRRAAAQGATTPRELAARETHRRGRVALGAQVDVGRTSRR